MDDFAEVEVELKKLRPALVSPELSARVAQALARAETAPTAGLLPRAKKSRAWWLVGLGLATAAVVVLLRLAFVAEPADSGSSVASNNSTPAKSGLQPAALTRVIYRRQNEGIVFSPNQSEHALRRVRYDTRETMQWRNPQTGASLRISYPAEQVVLTPVSFQ